MAIKDAFIPEFDHEMASTRRTLERVPEEKFAWKPHEKSMALGRLASHVAELSSFATTALAHESFDMAPPGGSRRQPLNASTRQELLEVFDKNVTVARAAIDGRAMRSCTKNGLYPKEAKQSSPCRARPCFEPSC